MKAKSILLLLILGFLSSGKADAQTINILYHRGYDCYIKTDGEIKTGGCTFYERLKYTPTKGGKYFKSNKLEFRREERVYGDRGFGENLRPDSLKTFRIRKKVASKEVDRLIAYIKLAESKCDPNRDTANFIEKRIISQWDERTFELNQRKIQSIKNTAKKEFGDLSTDSVIQIIHTYISKENAYYRYSSSTEFFDISFEHEGKKYSIFQNNLGGSNVSWNINIDEQYYAVISPELSKMISPFLVKKMRAKKRINQFLNIKVLECAFIKEED